MERAETGSSYYAHNKDNFMPDGRKEEYLLNCNGTTG
jgi:hypothetical protein